MSSISNDFQFQLTETLYFDRGDEVLELLGISLNPEVNIHSYDTYVAIRGEIELRGEYIRDEATVEEIEHDPFSFDDLESKRLVEFIENKDDDTAEFSHRFPVDISVPAYRIDNKDDIRIEIVNFDYDLSANSKLQLTAVAEIQGIKAEVDLWGNQENRVTEEAFLIPEESHSFSFEIERAETEFETREEDVLKVEQEETLEDQIKKERNNEEELEDVETEDVADEAQENELTIRAMEREEEELEEQTEDEVKDVGYLADIFRDEGEENYTRMKICIVQEDDTIESKAERFQISALQLIKQNNLEENFDINEGEILYIPKK